MLILKSFIEGRVKLLVEVGLTSFTIDFSLFFSFLFFLSFFFFFFWGGGGGGPGIHCLQFLNYMIDKCTCDDKF